MAGIQQDPVELLQAFALTLADGEWGSSPATPQDVEIVIEAAGACRCVHARGAVFFG
ncbi:hypothetical protein NKI20_24330 [Mesorhizobium sp. M0830]|uniref:hypothetical protein n=1 Tax=Mesorhizobium sp. M0830 TaxID=2957008 RepID=UPI00333A44D6